MFFCSGKSFQGKSVCLYPSCYGAANTRYQDFDMGIYANVSPDIFFRQHLPSMILSLHPLLLLVHKQTLIWRRSTLWYHGCLLFRSRCWAFPTTESCQWERAACLGKSPSLHASICKRWAETRTDTGGASCSYWTGLPRHTLRRHRDCL